MAPDLNSVPPSPRPLASSPRNNERTTRSRRTSPNQMPPPTLPLGSPSLNILPSNQNAVNQTSPPLASPGIAPMTGSSSSTPATGTAGDNTGVGTGPGPLRHPRPMTAADLHLQLEKEQEAVVNRLTRELSMLRAAQNASVASNTSSTSAGFPDPADHNANHLLSGPSHPAPSQRLHHRSSSSTSTRSITTPGSINTVGGIAGSSSTGVAPDRTRLSPLPRHDSNTMPSSQSLSRQNSMTGSRRSGASSPAPLTSAQSSYQHDSSMPYFYQQRERPYAASQREPHASTTSLTSDLPVVTSVQTTGRYEETAFHRHELDSVKMENDTLKRRIRELERTLRERRRQSDASVAGRTRSESVSTTASVGVAGAQLRDSRVGQGRERNREGEEEVVRVGESARSAPLS